MCFFLVYVWWKVIYFGNAYAFSMWIFVSKWLCYFSDFTLETSNHEKNKTTDINKEPTLHISQNLLRLNWYVWWHTNNNDAIRIVDLYNCECIVYRIYCQNIKSISVIIIIELCILLSIHILSNVTLMRNSLFISVFLWLRYQLVVLFFILF